VIYLSFSNRKILRDNIKGERKMGYKRKNLFVLAFIGSIVLLCPLYSPLARAAVNLVELVKNVGPAVVLIETFDKDKKPLGQGSGFFINKGGHLITNALCEF
jgi:S1-C subfamily serine protease